eukprot:PhF_6_TR41836/c0_g1_i1/m.63438
MSVLPLDSLTAQRIQELERLLEERDLKIRTLAEETTRQRVEYESQQREIVSKLENITASSRTMSALCAALESENSELKEEKMHRDASINAKAELTATGKKADLVVSPKASIQQIADVAVLQTELDKLRLEKQWLERKLEEASASGAHDGQFDEDDVIEEDATPSPIQAPLLQGGNTANRTPGMVPPLPMGQLFGSPHGVQGLSMSRSVTREGPGRDSYFHETPVSARNTSFASPRTQSQTTLNNTTSFASARGGRGTMDEDMMADLIRSARTRGMVALEPEMEQSIGAFGQTPRNPNAESIGVITSKSTVGVGTTPRTTTPRGTTGVGVAVGNTPRNFSTTSSTTSSYTPRRQGSFHGNPIAQRIPMGVQTEPEQKNSPKKDGDKPQTTMIFPFCACFTRY